MGSIMKKITDKQQHKNNQIGTIDYKNGRTRDKRGAKNIERNS